jgi:carbonic anhydrase
MPARYVTIGSAPQLLRDDNLQRRMAVSSTQRPFATILGCADSRVPVELIFDRGFGDLVVIHSAGEVLDRSVVGSLEFGVAELNTPLLIMLGHQRCGALTAAVKALDTHETEPGDLGYLVDKSPVLAQSESAGKVEIVGSYYDLDTGKVDVLDG